MEAPEGPARFSCPPDFSAAPFCPGPAFCPEALRGPAKQLWLIRAPAAFSPESLDGHLVPLLGLSTLKASQPDGTQKVFSIQRTSEDLGGARLLVPSGHSDHLTCSPPFSGSLSICERYGDPGGLQPLSPVAGRPAPQIPAGLKQRFLPFGSHPKRALLPTAEEEPPRKKKKKNKKRLKELVPLGEATGASEAETRCWPQEEAGASWAISHPAEAQPCSAAFAQEGLLSGEVEEAGPRSKRKKKKKRKDNGEVKQETGGEAEGLQDLSASIHQPWLEGDSEPGTGGMQGAAQQTQKGIKQETEATPELVTNKEAAAGVLWDFSGLVASPGGELGLATEGLAVASSTHRAKKKKKKEKLEETAQEQEAQPAQWGPGTIKQELQSWPQQGNPPEGGGGQEAAPGQRHKKKKKHRRQEAAEEVLAWPEQELGNS